jgi:hypothetical protein
MTFNLHLAVTLRAQQVSYSSPSFYFADFTQKTQQDKSGKLNILYMPL